MTTTTRSTGIAWKLWLWTTVVLTLTACGGGGGNSAATVETSLTAPTGLTATTVSSAEIDLAWDPAPPGESVASYEVFRNGVQLTTVTGNSYADNGLAAGTSFTYQVAAVDAQGNASARSGEVTATTSPAASLTAPTGLTATPVSTSEIDLVWDPAPPGESVASYEVFRNGAQLATVTANSYADNGLAAGTSFTYQVAAVDAQGNASAPSSEVSATTDNANLNYQAASDYSKSFGGGGVLVLRNDQIEFEEYGTGYSASAPVDLHSSTKSFWGPVVAAMIDDGMISGFDEPISDTITEWQSDPLKRTVSLRQVLSLTSGINEDIANLQGEDTGNVDTYTVAINEPMVNPPGEVFQYGPTNYYVLGEFLKRKLAPTYNDPLDYLQKRIFDKLGITVGQWIRDQVGNPHMPNGAYLTARDWMKFGQMLLDGGRYQGQQIINTATLNQLYQGTDANPGYGLTFWLNALNGFEENYLPAPYKSNGGWIYHQGLTDLSAALGAGKCRMYIIPSQNMVVVRQADNATGDGYHEGFDDDEFLSILFGVNLDHNQVQQTNPVGMSYVDPELIEFEQFNQRIDLITYQTVDQIWMDTVDPVTGWYGTGDGKGRLMADNLGSANLGTTFNGPEFGLDADGWAIFFAKEYNGEVQIGRSYLDANQKVIENQLTSGARHQTQLASKNAMSLSTKVLAIRGTWTQGLITVFDEDTPDQEIDLGDVTTGIIGGRWVNQSDLVTVIQQDQSGIGQIKLYDFDNGTESPFLTADSYDKSDVYGWFAPDYNNDLLILAVTDKDSMTIYRVDSTTQATSVLSRILIPAKSNDSVVGSPEALIVNGKSYVSFIVKSRDARIGSFEDGEVWVSSIEADENSRFLKRCDNGAANVPRFDPETLVYNNTVFVYYSVLDDSGNFNINRCKIQIP